jgi:hypothetical protein
MVACGVDAEVGMAGGGRILEGQMLILTSLNGLRRSDLDVDAWGSG